MQSGPLHVTIFPPLRPDCEPLEANPLAKPCSLSGRHMVAVPFAFAELNLIELGNKLDGKAREKEEDGGKEKEALMEYKKAPVGPL